MAILITLNLRVPCCGWLLSRKVPWSQSPTHTVRWSCVFLVSSGLEILFLCWMTTTVIQSLDSHNLGFFSPFLTPLGSISDKELCTGNWVPCVLASQFPKFLKIAMSCSCKLFFHYSWRSNLNEFINLSIWTWVESYIWCFVTISR